MEGVEAVKNSVEIWVLSGIVGLLITIIIILFRQLLSTIQNLNNGINQLNINNAKFTEQIKTLFGNHESVRKDIDNLEVRIDKNEKDIIEIQQQIKR